METTKTGTDYILNQYNCGYCGNTFKQYVRTTGGQEDAIGRISKKYSSQVKCSRCSNFLPTYEGCTKVEDVTVKGTLHKRIKQ